MRRAFVFVVTLALLALASGVAGAQPLQRPAGNQKFVDQVVARALSQRGVPFTYGGGDSNGPTRGVARTLPSEVLSPLVPGVQPPAGTGLGLAPTLTPGLTAPASDVVGFDASGLIVYAFAGVGVKMPRSSGEQYKVGQKIAPAAAMPGDLIFYGPEGTQSVALFVGNGQMVETTESGVAVSPVRTAAMAPYLVRIIA